MTGTTFGSIVTWQWDRAAMAFTSNHGGHELIVKFHKVGGRYSRTLPDGSPNPNPPRSYWTIEVDRDRSLAKYKTPDEAKRTIVSEYIRRFGKDD